MFAIGLAAFLLLPVAPIVYQAFLSRPLYDPAAALTLGNFARLLSDADFGLALINTALFAGLATLIAIVLGLAFSLLLERVELPFRRTLRLLVITPLFVSPLIMALAWSVLYSPGGYLAMFLRMNFGFGLPNLNSLGGMGVIAGVVQVPVAYLFLATAASNIPDVFERSARASGAGRFQVIWTIVLPLLRPALISCVLLNVMLVVDLLAVPLIIGEPARVLVLSTFLYTKGAISVQMDYGIIAAAAVIMIAIVQALILLQSRFIGDRRKYVTVGARSSAKTLLRTGWVGWIVSGLIAVYIAITLIVPLVFLILRSFTGILTPLLPIADVLTLENYKTILGTEQYVRSITNSILISSVGGATAVAFTFIAAVFAYRSTPGVRTAIEQVAVIPRAIPGLVVGLGFFYGMILLPGGGYLKQTLLILFIAFLIRNFPSGFGAIAPSFIQVGEELDRAARISGARRWRAIIDITLPLTRGALLSCFVLYFVYFLKEYSSAAFLFGPGSEVIGTTMLQLNFSGFLGSLAALACIELVILLPFAAVILGRR